MTAATQTRTLTAQLGTEVLPAKLRVPLKANAKVIAGCMVAIDSTGYGVTVTAATGLTVLGVAEQTVDNTGGQSGDKVVEVRRGAFKFFNSADADAITQADFAKSVYAVDNQTVAKTAAATGGVAEVQTVTPTPADNKTYSLDILVGGQFHSFSYTSGTGPSAADIVGAFKTAMAANAGFTALVTAGGTDTLTLTRTAGGAGTGMSVASTGTGVLAVAVTTPASGGAATRSEAGKVIQVENDGVIVQFAGFV
jgi:hypothetical protein